MWYAFFSIHCFETHSDHMFNTVPLKITSNITQNLLTWARKCEQVAQNCYTDDLFKAIHQKFINKSHMLSVGLGTHPSLWAVSLWIIFIITKLLERHHNNSNTHQHWQSTQRRRHHHETSACHSPTVLMDHQSWHSTAHVWTSAQHTILW